MNNESQKWQDEKWKSFKETRKKYNDVRCELPTIDTHVKILVAEVNGNAIENFYESSGEYWSGIFKWFDSERVPDKKYFTMENLYTLDDPYTGGSVYILVGWVICTEKEAWEMISYE